MKRILRLIASLPKPRVSDSQFLYFASAIKTLSEGIMLGSSAAYFIPETFQLNRSISFNRFASLFIAALIILVVGGILEKRGKHD